MQTAANVSLVLTDSSSFKRFADLQTTISYGGFYQLIAPGLMRGVHAQRMYRQLGDRLVVMAEHAHAFRRVDMLERISQILVSLPLSQRYEGVGRYYQALCLHKFGRGDVEHATSLLERVAEEAPPRYRAKAMLSLGSMSARIGDNQSALSLYFEAARFASCSNIYDPYATLGTQKMVAVINGLEGNHRDAVVQMERLFPLANGLRAISPHVYHDYLNGLAVELCEVGRLEEAKHISRIVVASPYANHYPEYRETHDEIELRGLRASRSVVALSNTIAEAPLSQATADASVSPSPLEGGNLVCLPLANRGESLAPGEPSPASQPARVLSMQKWKERMAKENNDPHKRRSRATTSEEKAARLDEMENLGTRGMLLRAMEMLGDERVTDDQLRRALIILEGLESDENAGA